MDPILAPDSVYGVFYISGGNGITAETVPAKIEGMLADLRIDQMDARVVSYTLRLTKEKSSGNVRKPLPEPAIDNRSQRARKRARARRRANVERAVA